MAIEDIAIQVARYAREHKPGEIVQGATIRLVKPTALPSLIGLCGYAGSGKNTVAGLLSMRGYMEVAFADGVRAEADRLLRTDKTPELIRKAFQKKNWVFPLPDDLWAKPTTPEARLYLQLLGTDVRRVEDKDYWVKYVEDKLNMTSVPVVLTDVRFPNELEMIHRRGGEVWLVNRGTGPLNAHASENIPLGWDKEIKNMGLLSDLVREVKRALGQS